MGIDYGPNSEIIRGGYLRQGSRGETLFSDGRPMWYGLKGEALTDQEAGRLMGDIRRRRIGLTIIRDGRERIVVSTVFLSLDHSIMEDGPILWETMVFGGVVDGHMVRYATRAEALQGHRDMTLVVRLSIEHKQAERARRRRLHKSYRAAWA